MITAAQQQAQRNRGTIFVEDGEVLRRDEFAGRQYIMRIRAPKCAAAAKPGSFAHLSCDDSLPMRRPMSIMRAEDDWIEVLFKIVGQGLSLLARKRPGDTINVLGPIGRPFECHRERPRLLLIGGGVGIPPMVFVADVLRAAIGPGNARWQPLAILGSEIPFPFAPAPSALPVPGIDASMPGTRPATMPLLEGWGVPARLASRAGFEGCFDGYVTDLADRYLTTLDRSELERSEILACGPTPMLKAVAALAASYEIPCQVSLEEYMACAVGGCAGCTVRLETPEGPAMKRVCVDGPVFDAASVVW